MEISGGVFQLTTTSLISVPTLLAITSKSELRIAVM